MYCRQCGKEIPAGAKFCTSCGAPQDSGTTINGRKYGKCEDCSPKSRGLALILACLGCLIISGIHRFYVGKIGNRYIVAFDWWCLWNRNYHRYYYDCLWFFRR